jgi:hypothetical protein
MNCVPLKWKTPKKAEVTMAEQLPGLETTQIDTTAGGRWTVFKHGTEVCIVDPQGRHRHTSRGQANTAVHLAMYLARFPLDECENADEALRTFAQRFARGELPGMAETLIKEMIRELSVLTDEQRRQIFNGFCRGCHKPIEHMDWSGRNYCDSCSPDQKE